MFDIGTISKEIWFLEVYYIISYLLIFSGHFAAIKYYPDLWNFKTWAWNWNLDVGNVPLIMLILLIFILIITCLFILFFISNCQKRKSKIYIYTLPIFVFITSTISMFMIPAGANFGFFGISGALSFFIFIYLLILFYDGFPTNDKALEAMHRRYLQYLNSFVWLIIFGGTWIIASLFRLAPPNPEKNDMLLMAFTIGVIENFFVDGIGLLLVVYSFNKRLSDIERKLDDSQRDNAIKIGKL